MIEGPPMSTILYTEQITIKKPIPTKLPHAQNYATVVPVNDTRTQCTTIIVEQYARLLSDHVFKPDDLMDVIASDNGPRF